MVKFIWRGTVKFRCVGESKCFSARPPPPRRRRGHQDTPCWRATGGSSAPLHMLDHSPAGSSSHPPAPHARATHAPAHRLTRRLHMLEPLTRRLIVSPAGSTCSSPSSNYSLLPAASARQKPPAPPDSDDGSVASARPQATRKATQTAVPEARRRRRRRRRNLRVSGGACVAYRRRRAGREALGAACGEVGRSSFF